MVIVQDCRDFDQVWNERLDDRTLSYQSGRDHALADHAAVCDTCRCRGRIYAELELFTPSSILVPSPSPAALDRWMAAAAAARPIPQPTPSRRSAARRFKTAWRVGLAASIAASVLVGSQAVLPVLFPVEPAPVARAENSSLLLEQAFAEATTMTWELAREVSAPAARIGSEALGYHDQPPIAPITTTQVGSAEATERSIDGSLGSTTPVGVELISGSAKHAFRFLIGTTSDDSAESEPIEGY